MTWEEFIGLDEKTLDKFMNLNNEEKMSFDFSDDGASEAYQKIKDEPEIKDDPIIKKFFVYKATNAQRAAYDEVNNYIKECLTTYGLPPLKKNGNPRSIPDPDSESPLLQKIYNMLWLDDNRRHCTEIEIVKGETINSPVITLIKWYEGKEPETEREERKRNNISTNYLILRYKDGSSLLKEKLEANNAIKDFLAVYHTLGNFIPFPAGCNGTRGTSALKDYWDLTLKYIYEYYTSHDIAKIYLILSEDTEKSVIFCDWLNSFGSWRNFVERNYLQPFVDEKNYYPKELWKDHFGRCDFLPRDEEECTEYFKNATERIKARSKLMIEALEGKLKYPPKGE